MKSGLRSVAEESYGINVAKTEVREGHNLADAERVLASYSDRFVDMTAGEPSFGGSEAKAVLRARLNALFARYEVRFVPLTMSIKVFDGSAVAYGWHEVTLTPKTDKPAITRRRRYLELWRKEQDGRWRIALQIDNEDQPSMFAEEATAALLAEAAAFS